MKPPVRFLIDYPDRELDRLTTGLRLLTVIPIGIVLATIGGLPPTSARARRTRPRL